jgi:hypothetical protein
MWKVFDEKGIGSIMPFFAGELAGLRERDEDIIDSPPPSVWDMAKEDKVGSASPTGKLLKIRLICKLSG